MSVRQAPIADALREEMPVKKAAVCRQYQKPSAPAPGGAAPAAEQLVEIAG